MHLLSRRIHGILDYAVAFILIIAPRLLGLDPQSDEARVPFFLGWTAIVYSLFTRYEFGLVKLLPFRLHLGLDVVHGAVLAASPWLFHFADRVWIPHLMLGVFELVAVALTRVSTSEPITTAVEARR